MKGSATEYSRGENLRLLSDSAMAGITRDILDRGIPFRFSAPGTSMFPFIRDGDVITLVPFNKAACGLGTIVAFFQPGTGQLVVHRIVGFAVKGCNIRGDNSSADDGIIPDSSIVGQVIHIERARKKVRLGLGPERVVIALLSRWRYLQFFVYIAGTALSPIKRFSGRILSRK